MKTNLQIKQLFLLSNELKKIYPVLINNYSKKFHKELNLPEKYFNILLNNTFQSITYLFFYKLYKYKNCINFDELLNYEMNYNLTPEIPLIWGSNLKNLSYQKKIDSTLGLKIDYSDYQEIKYPRDDIFDYKKFKNHLFDINKFSRYLIQINKLINFFSKYIFKKRNIFFSMANCDEIFWKYSFYTFSNIRLNPFWKFTQKKIDNSLRERIFENNLLDFNQFNALLNNLNFEKNHFKIIKKKFNLFLKYLVSTTVIEGSVENFNNSKKIIKKYNPKFVLTGNGGDLFYEFINAYAMSSGIMVINSQHGGYYGYLNHMRFQTIEISNSNVFITWGWNKCSDFNNINHTKFRALPSPWLTEREKFWNKNKINFEKNEIDLIFMPQNIKYFDITPLNSSFINCDLLHGYQKNFYNLISTLNNNKISTLIKYYNIQSFNFLYEQHKSLQNNSPKYYKVEKNFNKSLSLNLLNKSKLVVWDTPGTGFMECIVGNIPTIVLWDRSFSEPTNETEIYFSNLEKIGLLNRSIEGTMKEISLYLKSPKKWQYNKFNSDELLQFKNYFCNTDKYWWKKWKNYLEDVSNNVKRI